MTNFNVVKGPYLLDFFNGVQYSMKTTHLTNLKLKQWRQIVVITYCRGY